MLELRSSGSAFFMEVIWKSIPGYETHYEASSFGRIKSIRRVVKDVRDGKERNRIFKEKILRFNISKTHGRASVMLSKDGKLKRILVSRLVCLAFHGLPPKGRENVLHHDDVHTNNVPENLRWGSLKEKLLADLRVPTMGELRADMSAMPTDFRSVS